MAFPHFDRTIALRILQAAFYRAAHEDYVKGHVHNEEDIRASTYRHARAAFDLDDTWRLFTNLSAFSKPDNQRERIREHFRPDMCLFHLPPRARYPRIEIFVEIKHWPTLDEITRDLTKLRNLSREYTPEHPAIAFFAIVGSQFKKRKAKGVEELAAQMEKDYDAHVWLVPHFGDDESPLYKAHWNETQKLDPWRARLRHITTGNYFAQKGTVISD